MYKKNKQKGQIALETIIVIVFIIFFVVIFTKMADSTLNALESNHIKSQQVELVHSINSLFQISQGVAGDASDNPYYEHSNIAEFIVRYKIPRINSGRQTLNCTINIQEYSGSWSITMDNNEYTDINTSISGLDFSKISFTDSPNGVQVKNKIYYCGQTIECKLFPDDDPTKIYCSVYNPNP